MNHTLAGTSAVKIIENHLGKAYIKTQQTVLVQGRSAPPSPPPP